MVDVEKRATIAVENALTFCPHLGSFIDTNDRTPLTDGFIQVYSGLSRRIEELAGRVDVQVKGRTVPSGRIPTGYRMTRQELAAIREHGTMLLFVVWLARDGSYLGPPQYSLLSPFVVDAVVGRIPPKLKSINVPLRDLPSEPKELETLVGLALQSRKQSVLVGSGVTLMENAKAIWVHGLREFSLDRPLTVSSDDGEFVIEVETSDGAFLPLPGVLEISPSSYQDHEVEFTIECGGIKYTRPVVRQVSANEHLVKLSGSLEMTLRFEEARLVSSSINLNLADNLAVRVKDIDFTLALASERSLTLNGQEVGFDLWRDEPPTDLIALRGQLGKLLELLECLHIDPAVISMNDITSEQDRALTYLHASLVDGIELRAEHGRTSRVYEEIGSRRLSLMVMPASSPDHWKYVDPFSPDNRDQFKLFSTDGEGSILEARATVYDATDKDEFASILNLNLSAVIDAYRSIEDASNVSYLGNQTLLKLIHAADTDRDRSDEFLTAAGALCDWLDEVDVGSIANILNRYQIRARKYGLAVQDKADIRALRRDVLREGGTSAPVWEAGCAILLGDVEDIQDCLSNLPRADRENLETYPIWALVPDGVTSGSDLGD